MSEPPQTITVNAATMLQLCKQVQFTCMKPRQFHGHAVAPAAALVALQSCPKMVAHSRVRSRLASLAMTSPPQPRIPTASDSCQGEREHSPLRSLSTPCSAPAGRSRCVRSTLDICTLERTPADASRYPNLLDLSPFPPQVRVWHTLPVTRLLAVFLRSPSV